jgi:hypothetical protein
MTNVPVPFDEAGPASIATGVMMSHQGFCRAIRRFGAALEVLAGGGTGNLTREGRRLTPPAGVDPRPPRSSYIQEADR